jgi:hypothetical protein
VGGGEHQMLARMRRTQAGWKDDDVVAVLEYYGYEFQRTANHGAFFRNPEIATRHPNLDMRMKYAYFCVPRGEVREYVIRELIAAIDALDEWRNKES